MKKHAFTLAETLITLTIIGVVAAMTIPTLMNKYQEKTLESQFKKAYNVLSQVVAQNQGYECYSNLSTYSYKYSECSAFWEKALPLLKYTKVESFTSSPYKTIEEVNSDGGYARSACPYFIANTYSYGSKKYYMADGSIMYLSVLQHAWPAAPVYVQLDVNGEKGPNKWGYDMFQLGLMLTSNGSVRLQDNVCVLWEKGGKRPKNILLGTNDENNPAIDLWGW